MLVSVKLDTELFEGVCRPSTTDRSSPRPTPTASRFANRLPRIPGAARVNGAGDMLPAPLVR